MAALVLSRLARLTSKRRWREAAKLQLSWLAGAARDYPVGHSFAMLTFEEELWATAELVVTAQNMPEELWTFLRETPRPELTVLVKTPDSAGMLATLVPFAEDYPIPERGAQYYLCQNGSCAQPVDTVTELKSLFEKSGWTRPEGQDKNHPGRF